MKGTLEDAISLAVMYHRGQVDKAGEPYILHPLNVMMRLRGDENAMITAVLHDIIEDTDMTMLELDPYHFDPEVMDAIAALTHFKDVITRRPTYKQYVRALEPYPLARKVKMADLMDNMDPSRMEKLPLRKQKSLRKRYEWAMEELMDQEARASLPNDTMDMKKLLRVVEDNE